MHTVDWCLGTVERRVCDRELQPSQSTNRPATKTVAKYKIKTINSDGICLPITKELPCIATRQQNTRMAAH